MFPLPRSTHLLSVIVMPFAAARISPVLLSFVLLHYSDRVPVSPDGYNMSSISQISTGLS